MTMKKDKKKKGDSKKLYRVGMENIQFCSQGMMVRINDDIYVLIEGAQYGIDPGDDFDWVDDDEEATAVTPINEDYAHLNYVYEEVDDEDAEESAQKLGRRPRRLVDTPEKPEIDEAEREQKASDAVGTLNKNRQSSNAVEQVNQLVAERQDPALKAVNDMLREQRETLPTFELDPSLL